MAIFAVLAAFVGVGLFLAMMAVVLLLLKLTFSVILLPFRVLFWALSLPFLLLKFMVLAVGGAVGLVLMGIVAVVVTLGIVLAVVTPLIPLALVAFGIWGVVRLMQRPATT